MGCKQRLFPLPTTHSFIVRLSFGYPLVALRVEFI